MGTQDIGSQGNRVIWVKTKEQSLGQEMFIQVNAVIRQGVPEQRM
jgi:hypothetical protein